MRGLWGGIRIYLYVLRQSRSTHREIELESLKSTFRQLLVSVGLAVPVAALVVFSVQPNWEASHSASRPLDAGQRTGADEAADVSRFELDMVGRFSPRAMLPDELLCFPDFAVAK